MSIIQVNNLYKIFGMQPERVFPLLEEGMSKEDILEKTGCTVGINNASFEINKREVFVIMGLSGSGKSTVIRCLNRLIEPTRGEVLLNDQDVMKMNSEELIQARRTKMSMVFQHFGLLPQRTVQANAEYGLEVSGMPREERAEKARNALKLVGLSGYEGSYTSELSGGMQQRVGLARALANDPEVLLMDEAFSALDPLIRNNMQDELLELQASMHKTIVFITHDLDEALKIGDRIAIMKAGAVIQIGTPEDILSNPADEYVKAFVANVDKSKIISASSIMRKPATITYPKDGPHVAARIMEKEGHSTVFVVDEDRKLWGLVTIDDVVKLEKEKNPDLKTIFKTDLYMTHPNTPVADLFLTAVEARYPIVVRSDEGRFMGIVDRATILQEVSNETQAEEATVEYSETDEFQKFHTTSGDAS